LGGYNSSGQYLYMIGTYSNSPLRPGSVPGYSVTQKGKTPDAPVTNGGESMRLDMATGQFSLGPAFTMHRADFGLAALGNTLYALGGDSNGGYFFDSTSEVDALDVSAWPAGTWTVSGPDLPTAREGNGAGFSSAGKIWSTGGFTPDFGSVLADQVYRPQSSSGNCPTPTNTVVPVTATSTVVPVTVTPTPTTCAIMFTDVPADSTFYANIECLACMGIVTGYPDGTFRPASPVTRGELAKITSNAAGFAEVHSERTFEDVAVGSTFYDFVERLAAGTGEPCGPGNLPYFRPNANITRGQTAKIVSIADGLPAPPAGEQTFEDVPASSTFWSWIESLANVGAINGYACGRTGEPCIPPLNRRYFRPGANVTRGQAAKIVSDAFFPDCAIRAHTTSGLPRKRGQ
ncbi:MAG: S-layer homology domain-containing protein, partial [Chloroflexota bacterium]